jgi:hypothetical protein
MSNPIAFGEMPSFLLVVVPPTPEEVRRAHKLLDAILEVLAEMREERAEIRELPDSRPDYSPVPRGWLPPHLRPW